MRLARATGFTLAEVLAWDAATAYRWLRAADALDAADALAVYDATAAAVTGDKAHRLKLMAQAEGLAAAASWASWQRMNDATDAAAAGAVPA